MQLAMQNKSFMLEAGPFCISQKKGFCHLGVSRKKGGIRQGPTLFQCTFQLFPKPNREQLVFFLLFCASSLVVSGFKILHSIQFRTFTYRGICAANLVMVWCGGRNLEWINFARYFWVRDIFFPFPTNATIHSVPFLIHDLSGCMLVACVFQTYLPFHPRNERVLVHIFIAIIESMFDHLILLMPVLLKRTKNRICRLRSIIDVIFPPFE